MKKFKYSEITPENIYKNRRKFIKTLGLAAGSMLVNQNLINSANASTKKENMKQPYQNMKRFLRPLRS